MEHNGEGKEIDYNKLTVCNILLDINLIRW